MVKTTLYLPDDLKHDVEQVAHEHGITEAEFYRQAIRDAVAARRDVPRPETGFIRSAGGPGTSDLSQRVDEVLAETGFGEW
jgi:hypothetical protein